MHGHLEKEGKEHLAGWPAWPAGRDASVDRLLDSAIFRSDMEIASEETMAQSIARADF